MENIIFFCRLYLAEILFALVSVLCTALAIYCAFNFTEGFASCMVFMVVIMQAFLGYFVQKLERNTPQMFSYFFVTWFVGFILQAVALVICTVITKPMHEQPFHIMLVLSFVTFVALFGLLVIVADQPADDNEKTGACQKDCFVEE